MPNKKKRNKQNQYGRAEEDDQVIGRRECGCMAKDHALINNCVHCGRITCELEEEGPCFFCGKLIFAKGSEHKAFEEFDFMDKLETNPELLKSYNKAVSNKHKLLNYERNRIADKNIVDDEADWYEIKHDVWHDDAIREVAEKKLAETEALNEKNKNLIAYAIDFEKGTVKAQEKEIDVSKQRSDAREFLQIAEKEAKRKKNMMAMEQRDLANDEERRIIDDVKNIIGYHEPKKNKKVTETAQSESHKRVIQHDDEYDDLLKASYLN